MVIELSGVQFGLKSFAWFQNRTSVQREFDLKSQVWFQTKIARHAVQLPLYYIHFEVPIKNLVSSNILLMQYRVGLKIHPSFGGKSKSFGNKSCKICSAIWSVTLNKPWNLIGCFDFSVASSLAGKKMQFKAKNGAIRESIVEKRWKWECLRGKKSGILQPTA